MKNRWLFWILAAAFCWLLISHLAEVKNITETLALGEWQWLLAASLLQVAYYAALAGIYQAAFTAVGVESRTIDLLPITFAALFVNVAAPMGGASGAALFMDDAARRGQSPARTAAGTILMLVANFGSFLLVLAVGMTYLFIQHDLQVYEIVGALILVCITFGQSGVLLLSFLRPRWMHKLLSLVQRSVNKLSALVKHPGRLAENWAYQNVAEFREAVVAIRAHPARLLRTYTVALASHVINILSLYCLFLAFHQPTDAGVLVAGYAMGILFWVVSVTPQGIGVVEGVMTLVFASLLVPIGTAAVIAIAYRGLTFWLPLALGFVLLRKIKAFEATQRTG